jgi:hypothetical protein
VGLRTGAFVRGAALTLVHTCSCASETKSTRACEARRWHTRARTVAPLGACGPHGGGGTSDLGQGRACARPGGTPRRAAGAMPLEIGLPTPPPSQSPERQARRTGPRAWLRTERAASGNGAQTCRLARSPAARGCNFRLPRQFLVAEELTKRKVRTLKRHPLEF